MYGLLMHSRVLILKYMYVCMYVWCLLTVTVTTLESTTRSVIVQNDQFSQRIHIMIGKDVVTPCASMNGLMCITYCVYGHS